MGNNNALLYYERTNLRILLIRYDLKTNYVNMVIIVELLNCGIDKSTSKLSLRDRQPTAYD